MDPIYESIAKEIAGFLEPLPCPFCGDLPEIARHFKPEMGYGLVHRCKVIGPIAWEFMGLERDKIIAKWNTRK